jgi:hypothetical protein
MLRYLFHGKKVCIESLRIGGGKEREANNNTALRQEGTFLISRPFITENALLVSSNSIAPERHTKWRRPLSIIEFLFFYQYKSNIIL